MESLAFEYILLPPVSSGAINVCLVALGGVIALLTQKTEFLLQRGAYFALTFSCGLALTLTQFVWLSTGAMIAAGALWLLMLTDLIACIVSGYFVGILAQARSNDAYGDRTRACLALIPLANLVLLIKASQNPEDSRIALRMPGQSYVLIGVGLVVASNGLIKVLGGAVEAASIADPRIAEGIVLHQLHQDGGVEAYLRESATHLETPQQIDEVTTLDRVEVQGKVFIYYFQLTPDITSIHSSLIKEVNVSNCGDADVKRLFDAGASYEYVYNTIGTGAEILRFRSDVLGCSDPV